MSTHQTTHGPDSPETTPSGLRAATPREAPTSPFTICFVVAPHQASSYRPRPISRLSRLHHHRCLGKKIRRHPKPSPLVRPHFTQRRR